MLPRYRGNNNTEEEEEEVKEEEEPILLATPNPLQVLIMPSLSFELLSSSSLNHHNPMEYDHNEDSSTGSSTTMDLVERFHRATMLHHRSPAPLVSVP